MGISTDNWTWAGFLLFFAQFAWIVTILNLFIQTILFSIQLAEGGSFLGIELPLRLHIDNFSEQFNNQLVTEGVFFSLDNTVRAQFDIINIKSINNAWIYFIPLMKLGGYAIAVFLLSLVKNVLKPLKLGRPFQPETGRNLYWIGGIICMITPAKLFYEWAVYWMITNQITSTTISVHWPIPDFSYLIVGLIILSVAYVFNEGAKMAREQKLTV